MFPVVSLFGFGGSNNSSKATTGATKIVEKQLEKLLLDDSKQTLTSLEMNQIAFWTYHESSFGDGTDLCESILERIEQIFSQALHPQTCLNYSVMALQKTLLVLQHVLIFGPEKVIASCVFLGRHVNALKDYNTVLMQHQARGTSSLAFLQQQIKGGSVDHGAPVREAATKVYKLMTDRNLLDYQRSVQADPHSLVPVGRTLNEIGTSDNNNIDTNDVIFVTDNARKQFLQQRMEKEELQLKSNLVKSDSTFGSGYNPANGQAVVGAAHSLEEMQQIAQKQQQEQIRRQQLEKSRYSDNINTDHDGIGNYLQQNAYGDILNGAYQAPTSHYDYTGSTAVGGSNNLRSFHTSGVGNDYYNNNNHNHAFGGSTQMAQVGDLLDLDGSAGKASEATLASQSEDNLLMFDDGNIMSNSMSNTFADTVDILGLSTNNNGNTTNTHENVITNNTSSSSLLDSSLYQLDGNLLGNVHTFTATVAPPSMPPPLPPSMPPPPPPLMSVTHDTSELLSTQMPPLSALQTVTPSSKIATNLLDELLTPPPPLSLLKSSSTVPSVLTTTTSATTAPLATSTLHTSMPINNNHILGSNNNSNNDPFAVFDILQPPQSTASKQSKQQLDLNTLQSNSSNVLSDFDFASLSLSNAPTTSIAAIHNSTKNFAPVTYNAGSIRISNMHSNNTNSNSVKHINNSKISNNDDESDSENGFIMGGTVGSGW